MKTTTQTFIFLVFLLLLNGCDTEQPAPEVLVTQDLMADNDYPQAQQEIQETLDGIFESINNNDADGLISNHHYGPKFTEFRDGELRKNSAENEAFERGLVAAVSKFDYDLNDLQIDVYGNVGKVTFHADFRPTINGQVFQQLLQGTLIFVRVGKDWKIVHEHLSPLLE